MNKKVTGIRVGFQWGRGEDSDVCGCLVNLDASHLDFVQGLVLCFSVAFLSAKTAALWNVGAEWRGLLGINLLTLKTGKLRPREGN